MASTTNGHSGDELHVCSFFGLLLSGSPFRPRCRRGRLLPVTDIDTLVLDWLTLPAAGEKLGLDVLKVRQLLRDRQLLAHRRGENNALYVPAAFVREGAIVKGLSGTLMLLRDSGFDDEAALRWLFTPDDSLPGTPVQALQENRMTEIRRRAQALAF